MKQIKIKCNINDNFISPVFEWVDVIKYHGRKEYGFIWFKQMLNQMEIKEDDKGYPDSTFFFIGDDLVMEQNEKYEYLWVHYDIIWSFFYSEFNYNWQEVRDLIRGMVEEHFKMRSFPPKSITFGRGQKVEEHFKMRSFPPDKFAHGDTIRWKNISK